MMKKVICFGLVFVCLATVGYAYGSTPPSNPRVSGACFIDCRTVELGRVTLYFPVTYQYDCLTYSSSGNLFNLTNSTITGFYYDSSSVGDSQLAVRFTSFNEPEYRYAYENGNYISYTYDNLTITEILNTNIDIVESYDDLTIVPRHDLLLYIIISLLGVAVLCLFMKRF